MEHPARHSASAERDGQKPRPLVEHATQSSLPQPPQRTHANPCASTPQRMGASISPQAETRQRPFPSVHRAHNRPPGRLHYAVMNGLLRPAPSSSAFLLVHEGCGHEHLLRPKGISESWSRLPSGHASSTPDAAYPRAATLLAARSTPTPAARPLTPRGRRRAQKNSRMPIWTLKSRSW